MTFKRPDPDIDAERTVLAGILHYGNDAYYDVVDMVSPSSFTKNHHIALFECIKYVFDGPGEVKRIDPSTILSASKEVGYGEMFSDLNESKYLRALFEVSPKPEMETIRRLAGKIRKLEIASDIQKAMLRGSKDIGEVNGTESVETILNLAESAIGEEIEKLFGQKNMQTKLMGDGVEEFVQNLIDNPVTTYGISTGMPIYDKHIGGGMIRKELDIIAARGKVGKSLILDKVGHFVTSNLNIPVLNIDTELSQEQHWIRMLAMISGVSMEKIKTGEFAKNKEEKEKVVSAKETIQKIPYYYECVGGKSFEEVLSIMRRWVHKVVGLDENGNRKPCLIIYDYIKLLSEDGLGNLAEYQKLGFLVTSLKNFLIRYDVPCLACAQLNRDGIDGNASNAVAGSDRLLMYCSSLAFLKPKTVEEIEEDGGVRHGNRKLFVIAARNGPGTDDGDYINIQFDKEIGRMTELKTASDLKAERDDKEAFGYEGDDDDGPILI